MDLNKTDSFGLPVHLDPDLPLNFIPLADGLYDLSPLGSNKLLLPPFVLLLYISVKFSFWVWSLFSCGDKSLPGPFLARSSRLWLLKALVSGKSAEVFAKVSCDYGNLTQIGPNHVLTNDAETVRRILARNSPYVRGEWFDSLKVDPLSTNIIAERDPRSHAKLRYKLAPVYSGKAVKDLESKVNSMLEQWIDGLNQHATDAGAESKKFDLGKSVQYLVVDVISKLVLGNPFGNMVENSDTHGFLDSIHKGMPVSLILSALPEAHAIARKLFKWSWLHKLLVPKMTDQHGVGKMLGIVENAIQRRLQSPVEENSDMLDVLLNKGLTRHQLREEILISLVAGSETTITAIQGIILSIICNARVSAKLIREIDCALQTGSISEPISLAEAKKLAYLQACIWEGLRKFPPVGQLRERVVPPGGDMVLGHYLKEGTCIGFDSIGLQNSPIFGNDAEIFRPERWLIDDQDRLDKMHKVLDLVFGHGPTRCLGADIAMMEMNKIVFELFKRFHVSVVNPMVPCRRVCWGIFVSEDLDVCIQPRA